jgi:membrane protease YdiL (CAAX protease family)
MSNSTSTFQLSRTQTVFYHLYPGIFILLFFIFVTPALVSHNYPPQLGLMLSIILVAIPLLLLHLKRMRKKENRENILQLNGFTNTLGAGKLLLYSLSLVVFAFLIWGITQPIDTIIADKLFKWLPHWFFVQNFNGYSKKVILLTLILNLTLNGFLAPFIEELYFRGYLLPRMKVWGKWAFVLNAFLFSIYHFWQPQIYLTLVLSLLPMTWLVWKTKDLRLGILTHCLLNIIGALLSFGLLTQN